VFERFPQLTIVSAEADVAWIANVLERLDHFYQRYRYSRNVHLAGDALPSEVFKEHVYATFIRDQAGLKLLPEIGVDRVMWSSDYPHGDSTFPHTREAVARIFADSPPALSRKVSRDNAARLYRIEAPC
ncbi:MAG: amidohydrolase family protein, partial [Myxococcota bacterium]